MAAASTMQLARVWVWPGGGLPATSYLAPVLDFCHYLQHATNFQAMLHTVNAEVILSHMMPALLPCTGCRGLECLTLCPNFKAL